MEIKDVVDQLDFQLGGMTDSEDEDIKVFSLDIGEIFLKTAGGQVFRLSVEEMKPADVDFIDEDSWR